MPKLLKTKLLILGFLVVSPSVGLWVFRGFYPAASRPEIRPVSSNSLEESVRLPVEVIAKGSAPQWVYIEVTGKALPESGSPRDSR